MRLSNDTKKMPTELAPIDSGPSIPFRPLPKIVAPVIVREPIHDTGEGIDRALIHGNEKHADHSDALRLGDRVNVLITPRNPHAKPFWRLYEVTIIDGSMCRLVTPNKRFFMNAETELVRDLRDVQRLLEDNGHRRPQR